MCLFGDVIMILLGYVLIWLKLILPINVRNTSLASDNLNSLRPRLIRRHFADDIFKRIFFNENVWISIKLSLKFVPKGPINNIPALVPIMAWRRSGDKPLSEPMMVSLPTHICVTRPQWVKPQCQRSKPRKHKYAHPKSNSRFFQTQNQHAVVI